MHRMTGLKNVSEGRKICQSINHVALQLQGHQVVKQDTTRLLLKMDQSDMRCVHTLTPALSPVANKSIRGFLTGMRCLGKRRTCGRLPSCFFFTGAVECLNFSHVVDLL